eukprot:15741-Eustigmatos_ZCMA.PRE.1
MEVGGEGPEYMRDSVCAAYVTISQTMCAYNNTSLLRQAWKKKQKCRVCDVAKVQWPGVL